MHDTSSGVRPAERRDPEQDPSLTVRPLFAVKPLFAEGRQRKDSERASSGVGLFLHRPVGEVVKVEEIMSAIDDALRDMALEGYLLPVAQSEVVKTLKEICRTRRVGMLPQDGTVNSK